MSRLNREAARRQHRAAGLPETWWGNAILGVYLIGYVYCVVDAGVDAWGQLSPYEWWSYVGWHAMYQAFWPLWVVLAVFSQ